MARSFVPDGDDTRLAYDLSFHPGDMINTGLAGYAGMTGKGLREARPEAVNHVDLIKWNLWREWERLSCPLIKRIESVERRYHETAIGPVLSEFLRNVDRIVEMMLRKSASMHPAAG
jgi:hypothetical protein